MKMFWFVASTLAPLVIAIGILWLAGAPLPPANLLGLVGIWATGVGAALLLHLWSTRNKRVRRSVERLLNVVQIVGGAYFAASIAYFLYIVLVHTIERDLRIALAGIAASTFWAILSLRRQQRQMERMEQSLMEMRRFLQTDGRYRS